MAKDFIRINGIDSFFGEIDKELVKSEGTFVTRLQYIGEQAVKEARTKGDYQDQTGNLRSSIGYVILKDGQPITDAHFNVVKNGGSGAAKGAELLKELSSRFPRGYVLILCAGMNYASYVEDIHGKDVLTSAKELAGRLIDRFLKN